MNGLRLPSARYWLAPLWIVAALLRLIQLGSVPAGFDWDEAAIGYNAYSLLHTGRDEYGEFLPAVFRSFDDYKPPLYEYLDVLPVAVFGLNSFAVRLPSALFGILAVGALYFLGEELLALLEEGVRRRWRHLPALAALCLALSPWHIHFSRVAFEANLGVTLNILVAWSFLKGLRRWGWLLVATASGALALYAYHSERLFIPFLALFLVGYFHKPLFALRRRLLAPALLGLALLIPLYPVFSDSESWSRLLTTTSALDTRSPLSAQERANANLLDRVFASSRVLSAIKIADGYLAHFSLTWLFLTGDQPRHHAPGMGLLYLADLPFFFWGLYALVRRGGKARALVGAWLLIAPLAAAPTNELPHAVRTLTFLPVPQILTAIGLIEMVRWTATRQTRQRLVIGALILAAYAGNFAYSLDMYYDQMDRVYSQFWQYGYRQAFDYVQAHGAPYRQIILSTRLGQPYIFTLFFTQESPSRYLKEGGSQAGRIHFDKYWFQQLDWQNTQPDPQVLYIGTAAEIPEPGLLTIYNLNGTPAMRIAVKKP